MKNIMKKMMKVISTLVFAMLIIISDTKSVDAAASSIHVGKATLLPGYVAGTKFHIKPLKGGGYVYCLNIHKKTASNVTQYYQYAMNSGVAYILENGYPKKNFTGNKNKDFYITQAAVWWYLDDTTGTTYLSKSFKTNGSDKYGLRKHIKKLVSGAKTAKNKGYSKPSLSIKTSSKTMSISSDQKYYVSKPIDANAKNINDKYIVSVTSAPNGTIITDTNGNKQTSFKPNEKFLIKVPSSSIAEGKKITAKVKVKASSTINKAYKYAPKDNKIQPMVILQPYTKSVSSTISVTATKPKTPKAPPKAPPKTPPAPTKVTIQKLDEDTNEAVSGAVLSVKNEAGVEVSKFTTTTSPYTIDNLANGTYTVTEVSAPAGYKLSTKVETFTITDSIREATVKYYNQVDESVVTIQKLDKKTNETVKGAVLSIKNSSGEEVEKFTTTDDSHTITGLPNGVYTVEEVSAPDGYELSTEKETFTLDDHTKSVYVKFFNIPKDVVSSVKIIKLDKNTNNPISGAVLVIKDSNGNEIKKFTSTTNAHTITGLSNGVYTVEEVSAPDGYELSTEKETFTLDDDTKVVEVKFYNIPSDRTVTINKVDSMTGKAVAGAVIVVTNQDGEEVARFTSTTEAYVMKNLPDGVYTVSEEQAPDGYFLNEDEQTFTIDSTHLSYQVTIKNVPMTCENGGLDEDECSVDVPNTGSSSLLFYLIGIAIISSGVVYVYKNNKKAY